MNDDRGTGPLLIGPYGGWALQHAERFAEAAANACWFHGFDEKAFAQCEAHGIVPCVEFPTFRTDFAKRPDLVPVGPNGRPIRFGDLVQGVCLSKTDFLDEIERKLREGVRRFRPVGIWLDYLTGAGWFETPEPDLQESCFCAGCVQDFGEATGIDEDSPSRILQFHQAEWTRHKCERIASFGARYAAIIREQLPDCLIGVYMCPWQPGEFDGALTRIFAQDYALLAPHVDVFTPLVYCRKSGRPPQWGAEVIGRAPAFVPAGPRVQLILDALDFPDSLLALAESPDPGWGFQLFGGAEVLADPAQADLFRQAADRIRDAQVG
jgi:hypothetical protein